VAAQGQQLNEDHVLDSFPRHHDVRPIELFSLWLQGRHPEPVPQELRADQPDSIWLTTT
jgi:hypothetical protein